MRLGQVPTLLALAAGLCIGCDPTAGLTRQEKLQHEDPTVRAAEIAQAAAESDRSALPYLVNRLTDTEQGVRWAAIYALEQMTDKTFGYRHYDPPSQRAEAVARWRAWLGAGRPSTMPAEPGTTLGHPTTTKPTGDKGP